MEGLHLALDAATHAQQIRGVKIGDINQNFSHFFFADDVVILTEWGRHDLENITRSLHSFYLASGLKLNIPKSNLYGVRISEAELHSMAQLTGCQAGSLGIFYMSFFRALETIINTLECLRARFFWGGSDGNNMTTWIKWTYVLASYEHGGLEVGSLKAFNLALLQKWHWRFVNSSKLLWVKLMKAIHGLEAGFDGKDCYTHGICANIMGSSIYLHSRNVILNDALKCQIGCGSSICFWKDLWIGDEPLCSRFNKLCRLDIDEYCTIRDRFVKGNWSWQWKRPVTSSRTEHMFNSLLSEIQHLSLSSRPDTWKWSIGLDGLFAVGTARAFIDQLLLPSLNTATRWNTCLPRKRGVTFAVGTTRAFIDQLLLPSLNTATR
nr:RNA-directed DNA polymerase, eukaryota, reverse transcriptase zinc-binding domain protein [Tanacetum cinerariifolium]